MAFAALLCGVLLVVTFVGGHLAHSLAILAESVHVLGDLGTVLLNLFALCIGTLRPNSWFTFGLLRAGSIKLLRNSKHNIIFAYTRTIRKVLQVNLGYCALLTEIMAAIATITMIWTSGAFLIAVAIARLTKGVFEVDCTLMLIMAIISIIIDFGYAVNR